MSIIKIANIWIALAKIKINNKNNYLYRSGYNKQNVIDDMFSLINVTICPDK